MRTRTFAITASAVAVLATAGTATARPVPLKQPGKKVVTLRPAHRQLCICVSAVISPEAVAAAVAREEWDYDQAMLDEGFPTIFGTTGHYGYDVPAR